MVVEEGFPGQRLLVLPRPLVRTALARPGTRALLVTDCGYFPRARAHGIKRVEPIQQAVVLLCTDGSGWCSVDGVDHRVHAGQVVLVRPGVPHSYGSDQDNPWTLWWMHLDGAELEDLLGPGGAVGPAPVRTLPDLYRAVALLEEIVGQMERDVSQTSLFAATAGAWHFLAVLASGTEAAGPRSGTIDRAKAYLQTHIAERASVAELAAMARLSPSHFAALFRSQVGLPVLAYQTQLRMSRARELLDTTDLSVAGIAAAVGYPDAFYFSRQFRSVHGTTALRYRAQSKG
ncbi:AraC family transcriptional regulator [Arthrobacter sp. 35W]|uniref:AraC family transcriptional regulator n=1 Tax=Arthrobacter sp. 35W TaxID=1132441 RepID=UPI000402342B|nr:AraC family transcriptional regulator [Arthrobacter sp. 35W]